MMFENIDSKELIRDITKVYIIAFTKDKSIKERLLKEIKESAIEQAPTSVEFHTDFIKKATNNLNFKKGKKR